MSYFRRYTKWSGRPQREDLATEGFEWIEGKLVRDTEYGVGSISWMPNLEDNDTGLYESILFGSTCGYHKTPEEAAANVENRYAEEIGE